LPDDRITLGGYKMRVYLGPDDMPSPSEQARSRGQAAYAGGRRTTNGAGNMDRPGVPWPMPVPPGRQGAVAGFPEPSKSQITAMPEADQTLAVHPDRDEVGFPNLAGFQFEVLDDDDEEIIDLE
jgi:hypothetical protein